MLTTSREGWLFRMAALSVMILAVLWNVGFPATDEKANDVVSVRGTTGKPQQFHLAELKKLKKTEVDTEDRKGQKVKYAGVAVSELL